MLKDITIGQFFPGNSIIHRLDSRFKIVLDSLCRNAVYGGKLLLAYIGGTVYADYLYDVGDQLQADFQEP